MIESTVVPLFKTYRVHGAKADGWVGRKLPDRLLQGARHFAGASAAEIGASQSGIVTAVRLNRHTLAVRCWAWRDRLPSDSHRDSFGEQVIESTVVPLFKTYRVHGAKADRRAGNFPINCCKAHGILLEPARPKSELASQAS